MDARRYDSYGPLLWFARMRARLHFAALFSFFLSLFSPGIFWRIRARTHLEWVMVWKSKRARSSVRGVQKVLLSANAVRSSARCVRECARGGALLSFFSFHFRANKGPRTGLPFLFLSLLKTQSLTRLSPLLSFAHEQVMYSLTKIKGIGRRFANIICKKAEIDMGKRAGELSAAELESLMVIVSNPRQFRVPDWFLNRKKDIKDGKYTQLTSNQLDTKLRDDIERLKKMRNHRGLRHYWGIKVRGQHTKTTGRRGKLGR